jgi:hypothetical protein
MRRSTVLSIKSSLAKPFVPREFFRLGTNTWNGKVKCYTRPSSYFTNKLVRDTHSGLLNLRVIDEEKTDYTTDTSSTPASAST